MNKLHLATFVEILVNLPTRQWATVRNHERRIMQNYDERTAYVANSQANDITKYPLLVTYACKLAVLQHDKFDGYCQLIQLIQSERDAKHEEKTLHEPEWYKAKQAEYQRRYRARKAGKSVDKIGAFVDGRLRGDKLKAVGLPRPKSLSHAQKMKAELEAYIQAEEAAHGTGNVSIAPDETE